MPDLVVRNGLLVDGTGPAPRVADVVIADGRIAAVEPRGHPRTRATATTPTSSTPPG